MQAIGQLVARLSEAPGKLELMKQLIQLQIGARSRRAETLRAIEVLFHADFVEGVRLLKTSHYPKLTDGMKRQAGNDAISEGDREFMVRVNLNYRDICVFVDANYMGAVMRRIAVNGDLNFGGLVDHMVVGEDETFFVNDDSGAKASLGVLAAIR